MFTQFCRNNFIVIAALLSFVVMSATLNSMNCDDNPECECKEYSLYNNNQETVDLVITSCGGDEIEISVPWTPVGHTPVKVKAPHGACILEVCVDATCCLCVAPPCSLGAPFSTISVSECTVVVN